MGLRFKVVAMLLLVVTPVALAFSITRYATAKRDLLERRADRLATRVQLRGAPGCQRSARDWRVERRGILAYGYDAGARPAHPQAPAMPAALQRRLSDLDQDPLHARFWFQQPFLGATAWRAAESGPCTFIVAYWHGSRRGAPPVLKRVLGQTLILSVVLIVVGLMISVPLVRRVRRLTEAVAAAQSGEFSPPNPRSTDELGQLARSFSATLGALHARDQALKQYIAHTTHDLAIPLTVLQHRLQRLRRQIDDDDVRSQHVKTALEESHYIAGLIANMSALAKLESAQIDIHAVLVDLRELLERVIARHAPIAEQAQIELNWALPELPLHLRADSTLLEQALSNLVQNAVQYNSPGGHVSVILEEDSRDFVVRVLDDGPGVPDDMLDRVTHPGVRSDAARNRNAQGQGFGLAIAHRVCETHGWSLDLQNRPDGGLEAVIRGPLAPSPAESLSSAPE